MKKIFISLLLVSTVQPAWANLFTNDTPNACDASVIYPTDDNTANLRALFERDKNVNINLLNQPNVPNACYQSLLSADGNNATMHALFERDESVNFNVLNQSNIVGGCNQSLLYPNGEDSTMRALFEPKTYDCDVGYYLPANTDGCTICPENSYCSGGTYTFNETENQGITSCPDGLFAPNGMWQESQCGRILHLGDEIVYLRSEKVTTPSLNIDVDGDGTPDFFGNMTTANVYMHNGSNRQLNIQFNNQTYSVYDDTITVPTE